MRLGSSALLGAFAGLAMCLISPAHGQLFGTPKFKVTKSDDRFSTDGLTTYSGLWNRLSKKSIAGGVHIDATGVFVEPTVVRRRDDGSIALLQFWVHNEVDEIAGANTDLLSFGNPSRIAFLTGEGQPIALRIHRGTRDPIGSSSYNSFLGGSRRVSENGYAQLSPEQYKRIMNASSLAVKIDGDRRSFVYEAHDVSKTFQTNLRSFWSQYINLATK